MLLGNISVVTLNEQVTDPHVEKLTTRMSHFHTRLYSEKYEEPNVWKTQGNVAQLITSDICTLG